MFLRGEIQHKNLWLIDLEPGAERQLTKLTADFDIRVRERSDVALLDLSRPDLASIERRGRRAPNIGFAGF